MPAAIANAREGCQPVAGDTHDLVTSAELIRRARGGDRAALERLFERYVPPLRRWAAGRLPRWARGLTDTDDLIQDALLKTFRRLDEFETRPESGGLHAYLRQALRRRLIDELRRVGREPDVGELGETAVAPGASPLEETIGAETAARYEEALARLAPAEREAVIARVELGLDYERIGETLGKPSPDAARMAVARALLRLAREMGHAR
jgi:RNA polymerase sigma-70 factor (ECF subfamily)